MISRKLFYLFTCICIPVLLVAQNVNSGISPQERKELEEKFKALQNYYIDEDGVVVFFYTQDQENENVPGKSSEDSSYKMKVKVDLDEQGHYNVTTEEIRETYTEQNEKPVFIQEEITIPIQEEVFIENETDNSFDKAGNNRESVFKKKEPSYKTLEEAAMAVEDLLVQLRKQQNQMNKNQKNSLSGKVSGGVDGTLRKGAGWEFYTKSNQLEKGSSTPDLSYGNEPTYYINGKRVDKNEFDKLNSNDILRKQRKHSATNPNGEWWIDTK